MEAEFREVDGPLLDLVKKTTNYTAKKLPQKHIPTGRIVPNNYLKFADAIKNFEVYEDDVWVLSFPKSGTTWSQEMVWMINNDLDYEGAKKHLDLRFPYIEMSSHIDFASAVDPGKAIDEDATVMEYLIDSVKVAENASRPRHIKCHNHWGILPDQLNQKKPKIIYVYRNPKDTCVSYYHHCRLLEGFIGTLEEFTQLFLADLVHCAPYSSHVLEFWEHRNDPNILFMTYEDMKKDLRHEVERVAKFLGKTIPDDKMPQLLKHLSFEEMKNNPAVNFELIMKIAKEVFQTDDPDGKFMRKGKVGSWKEELSPETIKKFDDWIEKQFKGTGLQY